MAEISKTVDDALRVLGCVAERAPASPSAIARELGIHRTVVHRALATLHGRGFVRRSAAGWSPGLALLRVAEKVEPALLAAARPTLERLAERYGETFILTVVDGRDAVQIDQVVGAEHFVRVELVSGFRHPLVRGASGLAIVAFMDADAQAAVLRDAADARSLAPKLARIKRQGFAASHDEVARGLHGLSAPVLDERAVVGSIGIVVPASRAERLEALGRVIVRAAAQVGKALLQGR